MSKTATKNVYLPPTRVAEKLRDQLREEADRKQTSVSALIREAIISFLSPKKSNRA